MARLKKPNFMIVGVQKAGTTFLAKHLSQHPDVFFSATKEIFFFNAAKIEPADLQVYLFENFHDTGGRRWVGEGSTNYFHHARAIGFIRRYLGRQARIMVCLRHPIERLFSHYLHDYRKGRLTGNEQIQDTAWEGYRARSFYADRLKLWGAEFTHFRPLIFDDLVSSGSLYYQQAAAFLEIEPQKIIDRPINEGLRMIWDGDILTISAPPGARQVAPRFQHEAVTAVCDLYRDDVQRTMDIIGRDLTPWLKLPDFGQIGKKFGKSA